MYPWSGQLRFTLAECADPAAAVSEMMAILRDCRKQLAAAESSEHGAGEQALAAALSEARASMLFSLHSKRATVNAATSTAAKGYWWGVEAPEIEAQREAEAIEAVDTAALLHAFDRYLQVCVCVCVCVCVSCMLCINKVP